jgi:hypothetical protein
MHAASHTGRPTKSAGRLLRHRPRGVGGGGCCATGREGLGGAGYCVTGPEGWGGGRLWPPPRGGGGAPPPPPASGTVSQAQRGGGAPPPHVRHFVTGPEGWGRVLLPLTGWRCWQAGGLLMELQQSLCRCYSLTAQDDDTPLNW